ncbi:hypothetical protein [Halomonas elongata]|uniref:hypothetical protein n=1 Tax=Halomonas elongata TaxID=2746 RepID=UPI0023AFCF46|nr:hypothetical protein [Halomonas elongata]
MQSIQPFNFHGQPVSYGKDGGIVGLGSTGYVYACAYSNGLLKVGFSRSRPESRVQAHDAAMSVVGACRINSVVSRKVAAANWLEKLLVDELSKVYEQRSREWFLGGSVAEVVELIAEYGINPECEAACSARAASDKRHESLAETLMLMQEARVPPSLRPILEDIDAIQKASRIMRWDDSQNLVALIQVAERHGIASGWLFDLLESPSLIQDPEWMESHIQDLLAVAGMEPAA